MLSSVSAVKDSTTGKLKQINKLWEGHKIHTDLKTASLALTGLATTVGIVAAAVIIHQRRS